MDNLWDKRNELDRNKAKVFNYTLLYGTNFFNPMGTLSEKMIEYSQRVNASFKARLEGDIETSDTLLKEVRSLWEELISDDFPEE